MNMITKKWEATRLLEQLNELECEECAVKLEEASIYILENKISSQQAGMLLPIVRRCYKANPYKLTECNLGDLLEDVSSRISSTLNLDECSFCESYCEAWSGN